jgi:glycosyltransferase involved in cell wall biosynthesis
MPSWRGIADMGRPYIGYAVLCRGISDYGMPAVAGRLREGLSKVANVVDIWGVPGGRLPTCDAVLAMECVSLISEPYFIYLCPEQVNLTAIHPAVYERALGLFAENGRLAQRLAEAMGIPREKIHVIPPAVAVGRNSPRIWPPHLREPPRRKLLLSLSDCGGQSASDEPVRLALDVLDTLRQRHDPQIRLTISGLENWPFPGSPPNGVTFRGPPLADGKTALLASHDLLVVLPGLGFDGLPEAFSLGVPCVAARASEMSDAITPGITGTVVDDVSAGELAAAIATVLQDDGIYRNCLERAPAMAAYFSWVRVARQVTHVISREVGLMPQRD